MSINKMAFCLLTFTTSLVFYGCFSRYTLDAADLNTLNIMIGNEKPVLVDDHTIRMKTYYYLNSSQTGGALTEKNLISFNSESFSDTSRTYFFKEISTRKISGQRENVSYLFLVDKSKSSLSSGYENHQQDFNQEITTFFRRQTGYEVNFAAFAENNPKFKLFTAVSRKFSDINGIDETDRALCFDENTNEGLQNLSVGIDSALSLIKANATFMKRAILIVTDGRNMLLSKTIPPAEIQRLAEKAKSLNTSLNFINLMSPYTQHQTHIILASATGGLVMSPKGYFSDNLNGIPLLLPAYFDFFSGNNRYETLLEVSTQSDNFKKNTSLSFDQYVRCYNQRSLYARFYFEK